MKNNIKERVKALRALSVQIDEFFSLGKPDEGEYLLKKTIDESKDVEAYRLFFMGETAGYIDKDNAKQEEFFRGAINNKPNDFFLLRNMGVSLSKLGRLEEAIEWYDKALKENPKDYASMSRGT